MRRIVALSVALVCIGAAYIGAGSTIVAAQPAGAGAPAEGTSTEPSVSPEVAPPAAPVKSLDAGTYAVRLRDLEQRINELKEQIFRSKARLSLLAETVLEGVVGGGQAVILHENRMSQSYKLVRVVYALDGAPIFTKADEEGTLGDQQEFEVYNGSIVPGEHTLTVNLEYRGHGYGVFAYLKGYRFKVRSHLHVRGPRRPRLDRSRGGIRKRRPDDTARRAASGSIHRARRADKHDPKQAVRAIGNATSWGDNVAAHTDTWQGASAKGLAGFNPAGPVCRGFWSLWVLCA